MIIIKSILEIREKIQQYKGQGLKTVGFVPTMGFLHKGHESLIEKARKENDIVVVSIFVNPTQFGPNEDFEKYPRDIEKDSSICKRAGVDIIFCPEVLEMYKGLNFTSISVDTISEVLCGRSRPGHFNGVCTVVAKLFNIVMPNRAYFGEKDFQQLMVIKKMVNDLNFDIEIVPCPTIREEDGLAMSSRNSYLNLEERRAALILNKSLKEAFNMMKGGEKDLLKIKDFIISEIKNEKIGRIDYVEAMDLNTLKEALVINGPVLIALAVYFGKTRLIDNIYF